MINMFLRVVSVGVSRRWCTGVVFMQTGLQVNGALDYYCDVLLLKQLLPYICLAAGDFYFPVHHACTRAPSCCDTRLWTSGRHAASQKTRPQFCRLQDMDSNQQCISQKQQVSSYITDKLWLLTEWNIIFRKVR